MEDIFETLVHFMLRKENPARNISEARETCRSGS
jgi:hypothetical protein